MPTYRSIHAHPLLPQRLVSVSSRCHHLHHRPLSPEQVKESFGDNNNDDNNNKSEDDFILPVTTPQALLSRNPGELRLYDDQGRLQSLLPSQVARLRKEVADALVEASPAGSWRKRVRSAVSSSSRSTHPSSTNLPLSIWELWQLESIIRPPSVQYISTGCPKLDQALAFPEDGFLLGLEAPHHHLVDAHGGGLPRGYVTQIAGPSATGKTQLALQLVTHPGLRRVWYLSTHPCWTPWATRLAQLWNSTPLGTESSTRSVGDHVTIHVVGNEYQVLQCLAHIEAELMDRKIDTETSEKGYPALLVLDSASACLSSENNDTLLVAVADNLKRLARQHALAVLVINGAVSNWRREQPAARTGQPALGPAWNRRVADLQLWFQKHPTEPHQVHVYLERHSAKARVAEQPVVALNLKATGLQEVPMS